MSLSPAAAAAAAAPDVDAAPPPGATHVLRWTQQGAAAGGLGLGRGLPPRLLVPPPAVPLLLGRNLDASLAVEPEAERLPLSVEFFAASQSAGVDPWVMRAAGRPAEPSLSTAPLRRYAGSVLIHPSGPNDGDWWLQPSAGLLADVLRPAAAAAAAAEVAAASSLQQQAAAGEVAAGSGGCFPLKVSLYRLQDGRLVLEPLLPLQGGSGGGTTQRTPPPPPPPLQQQQQPQGAGGEGCSAQPPPAAVAEQQHEEAAATVAGGRVEAVGAGPDVGTAAAGGSGAGGGTDGGGQEDMHWGTRDGRNGSAVRGARGPYDSCPDGAADDPENEENADEGVKRLTVRTYGKRAYILIGEPAIRRAFPQQLQAARDSSTTQKVKLYRRVAAGGGEESPGQDESAGRDEALQEYQLAVGFGIHSRQGAVLVRVTALVRDMGLQSGDTLRLSVLPDDLVLVEKGEPPPPPPPADLVRLTQGYSKQLAVPMCTARFLLGEGKAHRPNQVIPVKVEGGMEPRPKEAKLCSNVDRRYSAVGWRLLGMSAWLTLQGAVPGSVLRLSTEAATTKTSTAAVGAAAGSGPGPSAGVANRTPTSSSSSQGHCPSTIIIVRLDPSPSGSGGGVQEQEQQQQEEGAAAVAGAAAVPHPSTPAGAAAAARRAAAAAAGVRGPGRCKAPTRRAAADSDAADSCKCSSSTDTEGASTTCSGSGNSSASRGGGSDQGSSDECSSGTSSDSSSGGAKSNSAHIAPVGFLRRAGGWRGPAAQQRAQRPQLHGKAGPTGAHGGAGTAAAAAVDDTVPAPALLRANRAQLSGTLANVRPLLDKAGHGIRLDTAVRVAVHVRGPGGSLIPHQVAVTAAAGTISLKDTAALVQSLGLGYGNASARLAWDPEERKLLVTKAGGEASPAAAAAAGLHEAVGAAAAAQLPLPLNGNSAEPPQPPPPPPPPPPAQQHQHQHQSSQHDLAQLEPAAPKPAAAMSAARAAAAAPLRLQSPVQGGVRKVGLLRTPAPQCCGPDGAALAVPGTGVRSCAAPGLGSWRGVAAGGVEAEAGGHHEAAREGCTGDDDGATAAAGLAAGAPGGPAAAGQQDTSPRVPQVQMSQDKPAGGSGAGVAAGLGPVARDRGGSVGLGLATAGSHSAADTHAAGTAVQTPPPPPPPPPPSQGLQCRQQPHQQAQQGRYAPEDTAPAAGGAAGTAGISGANGAAGGSGGLAGVTGIGGVAGVAGVGCPGALASIGGAAAVVKEEALAGESLHHPRAPPAANSPALAAAPDSPRRSTRGSPLQQQGYQHHQSPRAQGPSSTCRGTGAAAAAVGSDAPPVCRVWIKVEREAALAAAAAAPAAAGGGGATAPAAAGVATAAATGPNNDGPLGPQQPGLAGGSGGQGEKEQAARQVRRASLVRPATRPDTATAAAGGAAPVTGVQAVKLEEAVQRQVKRNPLRQGPSGGGGGAAGGSGQQQRQQGSCPEAPIELLDSSDGEDEAAEVGEAVPGQPRQWQLGAAAWQGGASSGGGGGGSNGSPWPSAQVPAAVAGNVAAAADVANCALATAAPFHGGPAPVLVPTAPGLMGPGEAGSLQRLNGGTAAVLMPGEAAAEPVTHGSGADDAAALVGGGAIDLAPVEARAAAAAGAAASTPAATASPSEGKLPGAQAAAAAAYAPPAPDDDRQQGAAAGADGEVPAHRDHKDRRRRRDMDRGREDNDDVTDESRRRRRRWRYPSSKKQRRSRSRSRDQCCHRARHEYPGGDVMFRIGVLVGEARAAAAAAAAATAAPAAPTTAASAPTCVAGAPSGQTPAADAAGPSQQGPGAAAAALAACPTTRVAITTAGGQSGAGGPLVVLQLPETLTGCWWSDLEAAAAGDSAEGGAGGERRGGHCRGRGGSDADAVARDEDGGHRGGRRQRSRSPDAGAKEKKKGRARSRSRRNHSKRKLRRRRYSSDYDGSDSSGCDSGSDSESSDSRSWSRGRRRHHR